MAMLENKGFHLTVKDGCWKLGGHGREISLRRQRNSYLVDVEFRGGLLECEKTMLRGTPGLLAVDRGVAGLSGIPGVDERRAVTISGRLLHRPPYSQITGNSSAVQGQANRIKATAPLSCVMK